MGDKNITSGLSEDSDRSLLFFWILSPLILLLLPWTVLGFLIIKSWTYKSEWAIKNQAYISIRSNVRGRKYIIIPLTIFSIVGTIIFGITLTPFLFIFGFPRRSDILFTLLWEWAIILIGPILYRLIQSKRSMG